MQGTEETRVQSLGQDDPLEKGPATHYSILAWRIPWTEEPGELQVHWVAKSRTRLKQLSTHKNQEKVNRVYISLLSSLPGNNTQKLLLTSQ